MPQYSGTYVLVIIFLSQRKKFVWFVEVEIKIEYNFVKIISMP